MLVRIVPLASFICASHCVSIEATSILTWGGTPLTSKLESCRPRHAQPRTRFGRQSSRRRYSDSTKSRMIHATTILTFTETRSCEVVRQVTAAKTSVHFRSRGGVPKDLRDAPAIQPQPDQYRRSSARQMYSRSPGGAQRVTRTTASDGQKNTFIAWQTRHLWRRATRPIVCALKY